ncbi:MULTISPECIES: ABC transporter permease [unclassified Bradyrhizobium]|uniref:ABC transporter permease n=1 Tax=unclassified Bradyrhizobium TaxID=2631580 RepID=UPI00244B708B|nr:MULTISPECIES: ABC transporter permease [unclassified Bradyrhizobium]MDH2344063.1 ABC transporter permease [Bradyrhizobium sp. SSUT77]MDH2350344.1 ABC transporter permease [Bradyrhizobium sp. SSUT112]
MSEIIDGRPASIGSAWRSNLGRMVRRLFGAIAVFWAVASFTFCIQALLPGDRAELMLNVAAGTFTQPTAAELAKVNAKYGFDAPVAVQYLRYLAGLARGDLGESYQAHRPVLSIIIEQVPPTIELTLSALALAWIIAILLTVPTAGRSGPFSRAVASFQVAAAVSPPYWIGTILLVVFALKLRWLPVESGTGPIGLVLPALALAIPLSGFIGQIIREEFSRVLDQPFVTSARMRGMSDLGVRLFHVLRHAVLPGVTLSGWALGALFSGAAVIETVFARPGLGGLLVTATSARDVPLVTGIIVASAGMYIIANQLVDLAYPIIDPRLKAT